MGEERVSTKELRSLFSFLDADGQGTVSPKEIKDAAERAGVRIDHALLDELVREGDTDGSGELEFDEFVQLMRCPTGNFLSIISGIKASYLDEKARRAGAESSVWYTSEMLLARERLKQNHSIQACLRDAWRRIVPPGTDRISREEYNVMYRLIYLSLSASDSNGDLDPEDCLENIEEDWKEDAGGKPFMEYPDFARSWFQLADLNTSQVDAEEYADFITNLSRRITYHEGGFRPDRELAMAYSSKRTNDFRNKCIRWGRVFGVDMLPIALKPPSPIKSPVKKQQSPPAAQPPPSSPPKAMKVSASAPVITRSSKLIPAYEKFLVHGRVSDPASPIARQATSRKHCRPQTFLCAYEYPAEPNSNSEMIWESRPAPLPDTISPSRTPHPPNCPCYACTRNADALAQSIKSSRRVRCTGKRVHRNSREADSSFGFEIVSI